MAHASARVASRCGVLVGTGLPVEGGGGDGGDGSSQVGGERKGEPGRWMVERGCALACERLSMRVAGWPLLIHSSLVTGSGSGSGHSGVACIGSQSSERASHVLAAHVGRQAQGPLQMSSAMILGGCTRQFSTRVNDKRWRCGRVAQSAVCVCAGQETRDGGRAAGGCTGRRSRCARCRRRLCGARCKGSC